MVLREVPDIPMSLYKNTVTEPINVGLSKSPISIYLTNIFLPGLNKPTLLFPLIYKLLRPYGDIQFH